jgi:hypothetical protein
MGADKHETRRKTKPPRHVRLYHRMLDTPAWRSLCPVARAVYVHLASRYMGTNNGSIPYAVREGEDELSVGKSTIQRALAELTECGFIVPEKRGAFSLKKKHATEWRLTEHACDLTHAAATKDYMKWAPKIQNPVPVMAPIVPVVGLVGTCPGTVVAEMQRNGPYDGTVNAQNLESQSHAWDTYSIPGSAGASSCSPPSPPLSASPFLHAVLNRQDARAKRASQSAVASSRGRRHP